jgi:hypothetical protein
MFLHRAILQWRLSYFKFRPAVLIRYYAFAARFGAPIVITILGYAGRSGQMEILPGIFQHFCALGLQEIVS